MESSDVLQRQERHARHGHASHFSLLFRHSPFYRGFHLGETQKDLCLGKTRGGPVHHFPHPLMFQPGHLFLRFKLIHLLPGDGLFLKHLSVTFVGDSGQLTVLFYRLQGFRRLLISRLGRLHLLDHIPVVEGQEQLAVFYRISLLDEQRGDRAHHSAGHMAGMIGLDRSHGFIIFHYRGGRQRCDRYTAYGLPLYLSAAGGSLFAAAGQEKRCG